jgi:hypothetical protein
MIVAKSLFGSWYKGIGLALMYFSMKTKFKKIAKAILILAVVGGDVAFYSPSSQNIQTKQLSSNTSVVQQNTYGRVCTDCFGQTAVNYQGPVSRYIYANATAFYAKTPLEEAIESYSNSMEVHSLIESAKNRISNNGKRSLRKTSTGFCFRYVKKALIDAGLVNDRSGKPYYLPGASPQLAGPTFKKQGFTNLLETPYARQIKSAYDAPVGAILIYGGGKWGHAEIRTADGFISDYFNPRARTGDKALGKSGKNRKLIGVYIKTDIEKETL